MTEKPRPSLSDLTELASILEKHEVDYILIGGAAMALHGFPRMTKDIDLLLPLDAKNNERLLKALSDIKGNEGGLSVFRKEWLDEGYSTTLDGKVLYDLLFVAADKRYSDYLPHLARIMMDGVQITTLDVDGMLASKQTTREEDIPDRLKLGRLKSALREKSEPTATPPGEKS